MIARSCYVLKSKRSNKSWDSSVERQHNTAKKNGTKKKAEHMLFTGIRTSIYYTHSENENENVILSRKSMLLIWEWGILTICKLI